MPEDGTGEERPTMTGSTLLIFLLGALIGVLMGGALCVRYLRHEIAADICPGCGGYSCNWTTSSRR